jgi:hypothetical protein
MCGGSCYYEILKRGDINYTQDELCRFHKALLINTIKMLIKYKEGLKYFSVSHQVTNINMINKYSVFLKSDTVCCIDLDDSGLIFTKNKIDKKYIANATTMAIFDLINGCRTARIIVEEIADVVKTKAEDIESDIYSQLTTLKELGFIKEI